MVPEPVELVSNRIISASSAAPPTGLGTSANSHVTLLGNVAVAVPSGFTENVPVNWLVAADADPAGSTSCTPKICPDEPKFPWAMKLPATAAKPDELFPL